MATKTLSTGLLGVQTQNDAFPEVSVINGTPRVSSLAVAEHFQKRHTEVLRSIRSITPEVAPEFNERNFASVEYADEKGEMRPMYQLSRDGFTLLAMGFAGKKALTWKIRYIEAFNAMERALRGNEAKPKQHALPSRQDTLERQIASHFSTMKHHIELVFEEERSIYKLLRANCSPAVYASTPKDYALTHLWATKDELEYSMDRILSALQSHTRAIIRVKNI